MDSSPLWVNNDFAAPVHRQTKVGGFPKIDITAALHTSELIRFICSCWTKGPLERRANVEPRITTVSRASGFMQFHIALRSRHLRRVMTERPRSANVCLCTDASIGQEWSHALPRE